MQTKISLFFDKVIEAGWLAAIILTPLFFNVHSHRVFEPDKTALLRSIALVMSLAWVLRVVEDRRSDLRYNVHQDDDRSRSLLKSIYHTPMAVPVLLLVLTYFVSTLLSIAPRVSLMGSYPRLQGSYTNLAYIVIFFLMIQGLCTRRQIDMLISVMILVSFPIALFGLIQHYGLDPIPWGRDVTSRVHSTMGNAIFAAAYLIMVVPLTLSRLIENLKVVAEGRFRVMIIALLLLFAILMGLSWMLKFASDQLNSENLWLGLLAAFVFILTMATVAFIKGKAQAELLQIAGYLTILITQLTCILYTQSRGPMIGLLGGIFFYFILLGLLKKQVWLSWLMSAIAIVVIVFLIVFITMDSPLINTFRKMPYLGRLGKLTLLEHTGKVRTLTWQGAVHLIRPHDPLNLLSQEGRSDSLNLLRPIFGFGPESLFLAYSQFFPPHLAQIEKRNALPDRSHNETFDALVTTGAVGFVVYLFVVTSLFYWGLKGLGMIRTFRQKFAFPVLCFGGGIMGGICTAIWFEPLYVGIGVPGGFLMGLAVYVLILILSSVFAPKARYVENSRYSLLILALVSALVSHFIEIHVGIAIAATRIYYWVFAAIIVVIATRISPPSDVTDTTRTTTEVPNDFNFSARSSLQKITPYKIPSCAWEGSIVFMSITVLCLLGTMLFPFISFKTTEAGLLHTIWDSIIKNRGQPSVAILALFIATWLITGMLGLTSLANQEDLKGKKAGDWLAGLGVFTLISLGGVFCFVVLYPLCLKPMTISNPDGSANAITFYFIFVFLLIVLQAAVLAFLFNHRTMAWQWEGKLGDIGTITSMIILPVVTGVLVFSTNIGIIHADSFFKQGLNLEKIKNWDDAIFFYNKAIAISKNQDFYYINLGRVYVEKGKASKGKLQKKWMLAAERVLLKAREIAPLNADHSTNLARLYNTWGELSQGKQRIQRLENALAYFADAASLSPNNVQILNMWGHTYFLLGDKEQAIEKYQKSLKLDNLYDQTYLFLSEWYIEQKKWNKAAAVLQQGIKANPDNAQLHRTLSFVYAIQHKIDEAISEALMVTRLTPDDYHSHKNLSLLYKQKGHIAQAILAVEKALVLAPDDQKEILQSYLNQLKKIQRE